MTCLPHWSLEWEPAQNDCLRQIHSSHYTDTFTIPYKESVDVVVLHAMSGLLYGGVSMNEDGRTISCITDPCSQNAFDPFGLPLLCEGIELAGHIPVEKRCEGGIVVDQVEDETARDEMAECLFGSHKVFASRSVHESAGVEAVLGPEHSLNGTPIPHFDRSLDHDMQPVRRTSMADDDFFRAKIPDIEASPQFLDLWMGQAIKRRVGTIKALHGSVPPR